MELVNISKQIIMDSNIRKRLAQSYKNGNRKFLNLSIDKILSCIQKYVDTNPYDYNILEGYILFLIEISSSLVNHEKNIIINYANRLFNSKVVLNFMTDNQEKWYNENAKQYIERKISLIS